jgi:hypothetical protein
MSNWCRQIDARASSSQEKKWRSINHQEKGKGAHYFSELETGSERKTSKYQIPLKKTFYYYTVEHLISGRSISGKIWYLDVFMSGYQMDLLAGWMWLRGVMCHQPITCDNMCGFTGPFPHSFVVILAFSTLNMASIARLVIEWSLSWTIFL